MKRKRTFIVHNTIFVKMCSIFFAIIIIIFALAIGLYSWGITKIKDQIQKDLKVQNINFSTSLTTEIDRITLLQYELINDWDLKKLTLNTPYYSDYEKSKMKINVINRILPIQTSSKLVQEIKVIIPSINEYIGTKMNMEIDEDTKEVIDMYHKGIGKSFTYAQDKCMILIAYPLLYHKTNKNLQFFLQTTLSQRAIKEYLGDLITSRDDRAFLLSEEYDMLIGNDKEEQEEFYNKVRKNIQMNENSMNTENELDKGTYFLTRKIEGEKYFIVYTNIGIQDIKVVRCISENAVFGDLKNYKIYMVIFAVISVICVVIFSIYIRKIIHRPLHELMNGFVKVKSGDLSIKIEHQYKDEFRYIYDNFNDMIFQLNDLINQQYKQQILIQKSELKQLQAQINPHFLYNSFLILSNRIDAGDTEFATEFCRQLGVFFRFITKNKSGFIRLEDEMEHALTYCNIQYARFSKRMDMELQKLPEIYAEVQVPRLILQPILENIFMYTLEVIDYKGFLKISHEEHNDFLDIIFEDNGNTVTDEKMLSMREMLVQNEDIEITGLINIHKRLQLAYNDQCGLFFERSEYGGLKVIVRILMMGDASRWKDY